MDKNTIYSDDLVDVFENGIRLKRYYFPFAQSKFVKFADVVGMETKPPTLMNGRWRCWGTGDLATWFPLDWKRPKRSLIFFLRLSTQKVRIGFTVEHSEPFVEAMRSKGIISGNT